MKYQTLFRSCGLLLGALFLSAQLQAQLLGPSTVPAGTTAYYYKFPFFGVCLGPIVSASLNPAGAGTVTIVSSSLIRVDFNCSATSVVVIANNCLKGVNVVPVNLVAGPITGPTQACVNSSVVYNTNPVLGAVSYDWNIPGLGILNTASPSVNFNWLVTGNQTITVTPVQAAGCAATSSSLNVNVQGVPAAATLISMPTSICGGSTVTFVTLPVAGATYYDWDITAPGAVITSILPYGSSVDVFFPTYAGSGTIKVTPFNNCGAGTSFQNTVVVNTIPEPTQSIVGLTSVCAGTTGVVYQTNTVTNANTYNWTITGGTITSGNGTNQITVNWPTAGLATLSVTPSNTLCGNGNTETLSVVVHPTGASPVSLVDYDNSELISALSQQLLLNTCSSGTPCVSKEIERASLNVLLNMGEDYEYGKNAFSTEVEVEVIAWDAFTGGTALFSHRKVLQIDESAPEQLFCVDFTDQHPLAHRFDVIIHAYTPDLVVLSDINMEVFYEEDFRTDVQSINPLISSVNTLPPVAGINQRSFAWTPCTIFPNYEFQLLRLHNNKGTNNTNQTIVRAEVDWSRALTIETQSSDADIMLSVVEGTGYYVWRVRPIGDFYPGGIANDRNWGAWSTHSGFGQGSTVNLSFGTGTSPYAHAFYYEQFDEDINFSYNRFFAEEGKVKEGITYATSLLQVQQNQVHLEEQDNILVSHTALDFVGRPALSSLPVPVDSKVSLGFENLFIKNGFGALYTAEDFDANGNYLSPLPVGDGSGEAFTYYSDNNPDLRIPTAEGYPYSRTLFYRNGANQVRESGGPGDTHRIRNNGDIHTQRTLYSGTADAELIRVFGDEAPASESVHKIINIDANNVASVSYIDKAGQTIANCLSINGVNPLLDPLPSQATAGFAIADTLTGDIPYGTNGSQTSTTVAFVEPTTIQLFYEITPATIEDICLNFCATCDYEIRFLVQNVDSIDNHPLDVVKLLPPDACDNLVQWDTMFTLSLLPGMYTISRSITAANTDPATTTGGGWPQTYLDQHLDSLSMTYDSLLQDSLGWIYTYLDSAWIVQLYDSLGIDVNVPNPDAVFNDSLVYVSIGCDSIPLPIIVCPSNPCPPGPGDFTQCFIDRWGGDYPVLVSTDSDGRYNFLDNRLSEPEFTNMIDSMLFVDNYDCDSLWLCWEQVVQNYEVLNDLAATTPDYDFDLLEEFLNCTGRKIAGTSTVADGGMGYNSMAYKYFNYTIGDVPACEGFACGSAGCTPSSPQEWMNLYNCVTHATPGAAYDVSQTAQNNTDSCKVVCESRRAGFISSIVRLYHNDSLYVQGDTTYLVRDTTWGQEYIVGNTLLPPGTTYDISWDSVLCIANSLVERCKEGCELTIFYNPTTGDIDSVGSQAEVFAMAQSMTFAYELHLPDDSGNCPPDFELIQEGDYGLGNSLLDPHTAPVEWDSIYGGTFVDYLLDAKPTADGGFILVGASNSDADGNKTEPSISPGINSFFYDYWVVKIDAFGIVEWDNNIKAKGIDFAYSVIPTSDGGYLLGGASASGGAEKTAAQIGEYDYWILKLDATGTILWQQSYGDIEDDFLYHVLQTADGGYLLTGYSEFGPASMTWGSRDGLVIKTDANGNVQWQQYLGTSNTDVLLAAVQSPDGGYLVVGGSDGGSNPAGGKSTASYGNFDMWVVKLDATGTIQWDEVFGGDGEDIGSDIILTQDGGIAVAGSTNSTSGSGNKTAPNFGFTDYWLVKMDNFHTKQWDQAYGGLDHDIGLNDDIILQKITKVLQAPDGHFLLGGTAYATGSTTTSTKSDPGYGKQDYWTVFTDANGNYISDKAWGGENIDQLNAIMRTSNGGYAIAGYSVSDTTDTKSHFPFYGETPDYWLIKIDSLQADTCHHPDICFRWVAWPNIDSLVHIFEPWSCEKVTAEALRVTLDHYAYEFKQDRLDAFEQQYLNTCADPDSIQDKFWVEYPLGYHHYTLYYYDRAGNLVRTVPPEGVDLLDVSQVPVLQRQVANSHTFVTDYEYNSVQQLVRQNTPDGNETHFFYNRIGQLRFSQNARQQVDGTYSYTKYDELGRITEVGQSSEDVLNLNLHLEDEVFPAVNCEQKTLTYYSLPLNGMTYLDDGVSEQEFLQNRVSYSRYDEDGDLITLQDQVTTAYSYDPHGNVEWMAQELPGLGRQYVAYSYDLVSSNMLEVCYNEGRKDQFFHRYAYDEDNRIISAETSVDGKIWDEDGGYQYYAHGSLSRMTIGEDKLNGIDYTYTILGWLKAVNHASLNTANDPGLDNLGNRFAPDAFGMQLNYFEGDFNRGGSVFNNLTATDALAPAPNHSLYNGNISTWASQIQANPAGQTLQYEQLTGNQYRYDELNRITQANFQYFASGWNNTDDYNTSYTYDANGNILSLNRNGYATNQLGMDSLSYTYTPLTNKLDHVNDPVNATNYDVDIDDQQVGNYAYDPIGQLTHDELEEIDVIEWTAYGKVKAIRRLPGSTRPDLEFFYDAGGNRIRKDVINDISDPAANSSTHYVRDATGTIMAVYDQHNQTLNSGYQANIALREQPIYGSSRLGQRQDSLPVKSIWYPVTGAPVEIATNQYRIAEDRALQLPYDDVLHFNFGWWNFVIPIGGVIDLDVSTPTAIAGSPAPLFIIDQGRNVSRTEDESGNLLFSTFTPNSNANALILDANDQLMPGASGISSAASGNTLCTLVPGTTSEYHLFTVGTNGRLYEHRIDMSLAGNGSAVNPLGAVVSVNNPVNNTTTYGRVMALIDDQTGTANSQLYLRKSTGSNTAQIVRLEITNAGIGPEQVLTSYASIQGDDYGMQISPDGQRLALADWYRVGNSGFVFTRGRLLTYDLSPDHTTITLADNEPLGLFARATSIDFSPAGDYLYFTRKTGISFSQNGLYRYNYATGQQQKLDSREGIVRRGHNGRMYYSYANSQDVLEVENPDGAYTLNTITVNPYAMGFNTGGVQLQEHRIYAQTDTLPDSLFTRVLDHKLYQLTDHLGNVRATFGDVKLSTLDVGNMPIVSSFLADLKSSQQYYPFGMGMVERGYDGEYRYGFNGKEEDDEIKGNGNSLDYGFRIQDPRTARFLSVDPLSPDYPMLTPYQYASNNPIYNIDIDGLEGAEYFFSEASKSLYSWWNSWSVSDLWTDDGQNDPVKANSSIKSNQKPVNPVEAAPSSNGSIDMFSASPVNGVQIGLSFASTGLGFASSEVQLSLQNKGYWVGDNGKQYLSGRTLNGRFLSGRLNPGQGGISLSNSLPSNFTSKTLSITGKTVGHVGTALGAASLGYDYYNYAEGNSNAISTGRLTYRTIGFVAPIAIGFEFGGPYGAAAGAAFTTGEIMYDGTKWSLERTAEWSTMFQSGLRSGARPNMSWFSDSTLKVNILPVNSTLEKILQLNTYSFDWKSDSLNTLYGGKSYGLIAQEVENVFPELVIEVEGFKQVKYGQLISILISSIQEQQQAIKQLNIRIEEQREIIDKQNEILKELIQYVEKIQKE